MNTARKCVSLSTSAPLTLSNEAKRRAALDGTSVGSLVREAVAGHLADRRLSEADGEILFEVDGFDALPMDRAAIVANLLDVPAAVVYMDLRARSLSPAHTAA